MYLGSLPNVSLRDSTQKLELLSAPLIVPECSPNFLRASERDHERLRMNRLHLLLPKQQCGQLESTRKIHITIIHCASK